MPRSLPYGMESFSEIRKNDFYYVDKTGMIADLLRSFAKVNLFTRPRRFGKTLNMSMLKSFFEPECDKSLFDGLAVTREKELCETHMGHHPVVFVSLKGAEGRTYADAYRRLSEVIRDEVIRLRVLKDDETEDADKKKYLRIWNEEEKEGDIAASLRMLCSLLEKHYGEKVILLIDEYDVPLAKAWQYGYYDKMADLIRSMFGAALKTNDSLYFAVLTGCLRVSKESIFTGLNNLRVSGIGDKRSGDFFGFTADETLRLLTEYGFAERAADAREWYDGYRFGDRDIYCPWDVISYCDELLADPEAKPKAYWINTGGNDMVKRLIMRTDDGAVQEEIERLIGGGTIEKTIDENLTYDQIDGATENLWSLLYMTGYLTSAGMSHGDVYSLRIPNREVRQIYMKQVLEWLRERPAEDQKKLAELYMAFEKGDGIAIRTFLAERLLDTVSFYDAYESFYHGFLLALLGGCADWRVSSNRETGKGRCDIIVCRKDREIGFVVEIKSVRDEDKMEDAADAALRQIGENDYIHPLTRWHVKTIRTYGISFWEKECCVKQKLIRTSEFSVGCGSGLSPE